MIQFFSYPSVAISYYDLKSNLFFIPIPTIKYLIILEECGPVVPYRAVGSAVPSFGMCRADPIS